MVYLAKTFYYLNIPIILVAILIQLGQYTYAISGYDSGYNHGCDDAKVADPSERYINQPGKGANFHSDPFMQGYKSGFNSCSVQQSDSLPPSDTSSQIPSLPTMTDQGDETSFRIVIIIVILFVISSIALDRQIDSTIFVCVVICIYFFCKENNHQNFLSYI